MNGNTADNFTYNYSGNKLSNINSGTSYGYDLNGNTTTDGLRGMTIGYNVLNLPNSISKSSESIAYIYSAAGEKLAKRMKDNSYLYYSGNMVYNNDKSLKYILFEEGMVNKSSGAYTYEYHLKDHLGNTRVTFQPYGYSTLTTQVAEYYPFGSSYLPISPAGTNKYLYNGKEKQDDVLGGTALDEYDYGARFYDARIGRWQTIDPRSGINRKWSPYRYSYDNPLRFIDPDGMSEEVFINGKEADSATKELQKSTYLKLSRDSKTGKISATGKAKTKDDKLLLKAINDKTVKVEVKAENNKYTSDNHLYAGGAFMGNTVTKNQDGTRTVVANQEVNPEVLSKMSSAYGKPGKDMMHEVTEAYQGGAFAQSSGISALPEYDSVYRKAHSAATTPSGDVYRTAYDKNGNVTPPPYYEGADRVVWSVRPQSNEPVIIQTIP